jgi:hypothetical protein
MSKKIELKKLGFSLSPENFDMNVDSSALYATNAVEMYRKAMIGENSSRSLFTQIYGIKDRVKLGTVDFSNVIKPGACDFDPSDSDISQKTYEVCPIMIGTSFCVEDLEVSFMSDQIGKGSKDFKEPTAFVNFMYETLALEVDQELEILTWQGNTGLTSSYLMACDGLEYLLGATSSGGLGTAGILHPTTASAVTSANVIAKLVEARNAIPKAVKSKSDFAYLVSVNVYEALMDATSANMQTGFYYVDKIDLKFQGTQVVKLDGASDNVIVAVQLSNLLNISDLASDTQGFNVVDFMKTILNRRIGVRTDAKVKFDYKVANEIYFHKP